jgi:hypothetical protein
MPAASQDHVHRLIRSMSPAEKRYYKLHLARAGHEGLGYQEQLFDAIAAMDAYDERSLLHRFRHAPFTRHFAITKRRLYESILHCLEAFHADSSIDARIGRLLHQVEILHRRALYADARKVLTSARRLAAAHELPVALIAIGSWERRLRECDNLASTDMEELEGLAVAAAAQRRSQEELDELWHLKGMVFKLLYRDAAAMDPQAVRNLLTHPLLREGAMLSTARARYLHHHIRSAAAYALGFAQECRRQLAANLDLLEPHRRLFADEPNLILGVLSNLAYVSMQCGDHDGAHALLKRIRSVPGEWHMPETEDLDLQLFATTTTLELSLLLRSGETTKSLELLPVLRRGLIAHAGRIGPVRRAGLLYLAAYAYVMAHQPDEALRWCNELLNGLKHGDHSDAARFGRLLHLLILCDAGKLDLLPYAVRNTERYLKQDGGEGAFEALLLRAMRALARAKRDPERTTALQAFRHELAILLDDPAERGILDHLDPEAWAESRLTGKPMGDILKERLRRMGHAA